MAIFKNFLMIFLIIGVSFIQAEPSRWGTFTAWVKEKSSDHMRTLATYKNAMATLVGLQSCRTYEKPLPESIKKILDEHCEDITKSNVSVNHYDWLPDWMVKAGHRRLEGAQRFSAAINEINSKILMVPQKYRYQTPDGRCYTISEFLKDSKQEITLGELKELIRLAKKLQWLDSHPGNFIKVADNVIGLPDTKPNYLGSNYDEYQTKSVIFQKLSGARLTPEAQEYIHKKHEEYLIYYRDPKVKAQLAIKKFWKPYKSMLNNFNNNFRTQFAIAEIF